MDETKRKFKSSLNFIVTFTKWIILAVVTGIIGGAVGSAFHIGIEYVTEFRVSHDFVILFLLPGGLLIVFLYALCGMKDDRGTALVIDSVRENGKVPFLMAPLIFVSTIITHFCGGSAGREGAALQLGGSIGSSIGRLFKLNNRDRGTIVLCGMSGVFSSLFGTPLTATFFVMEVVSVGVIYYSSIIPCVISAVSAYLLSLALGTKPVSFTLETVPMEPFLILKTIGLAALCSLLSIIFCIALKQSASLFAKYIKNPYFRISIGSVLIIIFTFLVQTRDYNGAGMDIITRAIEQGQAEPLAFLFKLILTVITIASGFKGGEIVPTFFIGATFGAVMGPLLGLSPQFGAAVGLIALFCGATNTPIASLILSIELFGSSNMVLFGIACGVSYMLSGYYSLYPTQKFVYSKLKAEFINRDPH